MGNRVKSRGILRNCRNDGTFRKSQGIDLFIEISSCRYLDTEGVGTQINGVEIRGYNAFFQVFLWNIRLAFQFKGQILLLELTDILLEGAFIQAASEDIVLYELLGDGGTASVRAVIGNYTPDCTKDGLDIYTVVSPETFILYGNKSIYKILWELLVSNSFSVGAGLDQRCCDIALCIKDF